MSDRGKIDSTYVPVHVVQEHHKRNKDWELKKKIRILILSS